MRTIQQPLLDYIFNEVDFQRLNRFEVNEYPIYLKQIIIPAMPIAQQVKFFSYKVKLNRQLVKIDSRGLSHSVERFSGRKAG